MANLANCLRFAKLKPSKLVVTIDNPLANLFIRQTFFCQTLEKSRFAKHSARNTFPLYGIHSLSFVDYYLFGLLAVWNSPDFAYRSLGKIRCENNFVGRHVRQKLNTRKFSYHKEIE